MNDTASLSSQTRATSFVDAATIMRIKNLQLRAKTVVEGFYNGLHRSPFHGFSVEFSEYRQYAPGDDPRYLDWKLYARSDRYYIKRFEDETTHRCHHTPHSNQVEPFRAMDKDDRHTAPP